MKKHKRWLLVTLSLLLTLICVVIWTNIARFIPSFPEILFGQVALSGETKSLPPRAYQSAEFILGQVALSEVERAVYIPLHEDVLFWSPQYVGFARAELSNNEIRLIQEILSAGHLFYRQPSGQSFQCVVQSPLRQPSLVSCPEGEQYLDQFVTYQSDARQNHTVGVFQFYLTAGRMAEIRIYPSQQGMAYTPFELSGNWWLNGIAAPSQLLEDLSSRASLPPISILWPEKTAGQANARAARVVGNRYPRALQSIQDSSAVRQVFGPIREIRPAAGRNDFSSWMDSTSLFLTFRVLGEHGEGAVILRGYDCFVLQMVFQGLPRDDQYSGVCP